MNHGWVDTYLGLLLQMYGLAFFGLGLTALMIMRRNSGSVLLKNMGWLAAFGMLHGVQEFIDAERLRNSASWLVMLSAALMVASFVVLLEFGRRLWNERTGIRRLNAIPLFATAGLGTLLLMLSATAAIAGLELGSRYLLGMPGAVLSGIGFFSQAARMAGAGPIPRWLRLAAGAMLGYAALTLLLSNDAGILLANWLPTSADFLVTTGLPVQLALALCAMLLAVSFVMFGRYTAVLTNTTLKRVTNRLDGFVYRCSNDKDWTVTFMSEGGESLTGYPATDFLSGKRHFAQQIHPEDQQHVWDAIQAALAMRQGFRLQYRMLNRAGTVCWCFEEGRGVFDGHGKLLYLEGLVRNDDERHLEQLLLTRLSRVASATTNGVIITDINGRVEWINEGFSRITGYSLNEIRGRKPGEVLQGPDTNPATVAKIRASLAQREGFEAELINYTCDGKPYWVHILCSPLHDEKGILQGFMAIESDISPQKHAQTALAEQAQHTQAILDNMVDGIITIDANGTMQSFNLAATRIFGFTADEVLGKNVNILMPDPHRKAHDGYLANYQRSGIAKIIGIGREVNGQRKDGSLFPMKLAISQVIRNGQPLYVGLVSDISERKQFEVQLRELNQSLEQRVARRTEELEHANAAKNDFLSRMSHELRTPLNAILGFTQLLQLSDVPPLSGQQAANVQEIRAAGEHLLALVNEILDLAQIDSGQLLLNLEPIALQAALEHCVAQIAPLARERGIEPTLKIQQPYIVLADSTRLKQVLFNLLSNAVKYNREGGSIEIECIGIGGVEIESLPVTEQYVRINVRDTGQGLSNEHQAMLFRPFERLESAYNGIEGTGIGLALARQLVEGMQGRIGVSSTPGVGSCFWFELPLCQAPDLVVAQTDHVPQVTSTNLNQAAAKVTTVLYIEDNPANLRLVQKILARHHEFKLLTANNGEQGITLALRQQPELILLDINMPGMDGFEVLKQLQANPLTQHVPVIALTANAMQRDIDRARAAGFVDYITKPIQVPVFLQSIKHGLQSVQQPLNSEDLT